MDLGSGAILPLDVTAVVALLAKTGLRYTGVAVGLAIFVIFWGDLRIGKLSAKLE